MKNKKIFAAAIFGLIVAGTAVMRFSTDNDILLPKLYESDGLTYEKSDERKRELGIAVLDMTGLFNPVFCESEGDKMVSGFVFEPLMKKDGHGMYIPCLADEVTVSEDGLSMKIKLKKNVLFSDGSSFGPFDAAASVAAMALSPVEDSNSIYDNISGIDAFREGKSPFPEGIIIGDEGIEIHFDMASPDNLYVLDTHVQKADFATASEGFVDASSAMEVLNAESRGGIGTGAYVLPVGAEPSYEVKLSANQNYRDDINGIESVVFFYTTTSDIAEGLENSEEGKELTYDIILWEDSERLLTAVEENGSYDVYAKPEDTVYGLFFNKSQSDFDDEKLRQDMSVIVRDSIGKGELISKEFMSIIYPAEHFGIHELFEKDGVKERLPSVERPNLSYNLPVMEENSLQTELAAELAALYREYGIEINIIPKTADEYTADILMGTGYDLLLSSVNFKESADDLRKFYEESPSVTDPFVTEGQLAGLSEYEKSYDPEAASAAKKAFFEDMKEGAPFVPIGRKSKLMAVSSDLDGMRLNVDEEFIGNVHRISVK